MALPRRIILLGTAGAGKTTLARELAQRLGMPHLCLDEMWRGVQPAGDEAAFLRLIDETHARPAWVSDGNFAKVSFALRAPRAELFVWLEPPRALCLWRALRRTFRRGEFHRLREFGQVARFIEGFERRNRPLIEGLRQQLAPDTPVIHLQRPSVDRLLAAWAQRAR